MPIYHSTICAAVLLFPLFCAEQILAQDVPPPNNQHLNPVQIGVAGESQYHRCFEQPHGAMDAIHRLPASARYWLEEDAVYIITPEEHCAFLHLETDEERDQFIEQFWYRRASDPVSPDHDFKTEHYRRIAFANEKYGGQLPGWKTDRGKVYVVCGPPDSVDLSANRGPAGTPPNQGPETAPHPMEKWHYHYIKGIGDNVQLDFAYATPYRDYFLATDQNLLSQADPNPDRFPVTPEKMELYVLANQPPKIKFKDLEAILVSRIVRDQVKFSHRVEFSPATHATTLARIDIQIPCETCAHDGQIDASLAYPLFIRVSKPSGWVVDTLELTADIALRARSDSGLTLNAHLDVPLAPGMYQLAVVAKNAATGEVGVLRAQLDVPTYRTLETKY
jgi:GWxTD domain-containing protein